MTQAEKQELFNRMVTGLWAQGQASYCGGENGIQRRCLYRGPEGRKCAIGMLITDEAYARGGLGRACDVTAKSVDSRPVQSMLMASGIPADDLDFLVHAQRELHDTLVFASNFRGSLRNSAENFAATYGLKMPSLPAVAE